MTFIRKGACRRLFLLLLISGMGTVIAGPDITKDVARVCPASHYDESAVVSSVHDGDTVRLEDGRKIRLIGINAPEMARGGKPEQAFAARARDQLKQLITSSGHRVKLVYGKERFDQYQRTLAHLFLPDNQNLQAALLQHGLATANAYPPNVAFTDCYQQVEQAARCKSSGIWSSDDYATKNSADLKPGSEGFRSVSGLVERISETSKGLWLFLQGGLMIGIRTADLPNFDKNAMKSLTHKNITVRGWLHPKNNSRDTTKKGVRFYMGLRHPSAITSTATTGNVTKC